MPKYDPAYVGKLLPGAEMDAQRFAADMRESGIQFVQVLSGPGCEVSEAQDGTVYPIDEVPALPFPGCKRSPCCACCYVPYLEGETD